MSPFRRLVALAAILLVGLSVFSAPGHVDASDDPVIAAAGDIACDPASGGYYGGDGYGTGCNQKYTAPLLAGADAVLTLGDEQYACGGLSAFQQSYDPTWGAYKSVTYPVPGNHEYQTSGGTDCSTNARGYFTYFGAAAGDPTKGYYSYYVGAWHIIALNSECSFVGGCGAGSPQDIWLRNELATSTAPCTMAYWHKPRFSSNGGTGDSTFSQLWNDLYAAHADVVLNGHQHWYERFGLQNPSAQADPNGIREFIVGTGGESYVLASTTRAANSEAVFSGGDAFGVLRMTLHPDSYDWNFVALRGNFTDQGSTRCHNATTNPGPDITSPTTSISCNASGCQSSAYANAVTVALSAVDASDGSGVDKTYYTTDGSTPTTSSAVYGGPFQVAQTTTVMFFSTDVAGNAEGVRSQVIQIGATPPQDTTAPISTITCNGASCGSGWFRTTPVKIRLGATDEGSGVNKIYYTTDGSTPTTSSTVYAGVFNVSATTAVRFFASDKAGNLEAAKAQPIGIDTTAPSSSSACNGSTCTGWYRSIPVSVTLTATDAASGIAATFYTTDGTTPTASSSVYTAPILITQTTTVKFFSRDVAGNRDTVKTVTVKVDAAAPTVAITSPQDGASVSRGTRVSITAAATDLGTGGNAASGIASVTFSVDGILLKSDGSSPYSAIWGTSTATRASHAITVVATDRAGNQSTVSISVTVV
jgi:hypothetical protein